MLIRYIGTEDTFFKKGKKYQLSNIQIRKAVDNSSYLTAFIFGEEGLVAVSYKDTTKFNTDWEYIYD